MIQPHLSPKQSRLVVLIVGSGLSVKQAAARLSMSHSTARCHMRIIYERYGVTCKDEFMHLFVDQEKLPPAA